MLNRFTQLFRSDDHRKKAEMAFSRLLTQSSLEGLSYREGMNDTRRRTKSQASAIGVWLVPCARTGANQPDFTRPIPAVTFDLRQMGVGVLTRKTLEAGRIVAAIPDKEDVWRLFECEVRHQSQRPGGWVQVGLQICSIFDASHAELTMLRSHFTPVPAKVEEFEPLGW